MVSYTITPLTDHTGAELIGLVFARPIDTQARATLSRAFTEHHVLVMRDQHSALRRPRRGPRTSFRQHQITMTTRQKTGVAKGGRHGIRQPEVG